MRNLLALVYLFMALLVSAEGQPGEAIPGKKVPVLYGHTFPTVGGFRSPFVNTSLEANLGFGNTSLLKIKGIDLGDYEILSFEGKLLFYNMRVNYTQRFTPWLSLHVSMNAAGRVGTNMSTIMADGVNTLSGGTIGWLVRIMERERFYMSGSLSVNNMTGNLINVADYFRDLINNVPNPTVTKRIPAMAVSAGIQGAYAFSPTFGLQFMTEYAYGESFERKKNQGYFIAGINGDADLNPRYRVPLGFALGYTLTSAPEIVFGEGGASNLATLKLGYTGSDDFELGLQYTFYDVKIRSVEDKPYVSKIVLLLRFFF